MRRLLLSVAVFAALIGALAVFSFWPSPPPIVASLRQLPEIAKVEYTGQPGAALTVIHMRDWHYVPRDLCRLDGIDFDANLDAVEKVQADQLAVARYLIQAGRPGPGSEATSTRTNA
jgi:hypothetical protein